MPIASILTLTRYGSSADGTASDASITSHRIKSDFVRLLILTPTQSTLCCAGLWGAGLGCRPMGPQLSNLLIKADWGLNRPDPRFSRTILFRIITPVVQGLIPAQTWEPDPRTGGGPHYQQAHGLNKPELG